MAINITIPGSSPSSNIPPSLTISASSPPIIPVYPLKSTIPQRGVDYWTPEDKKEIISDVNSGLQPQIDSINVGIADLEGFVGYSEKDIFGVEIDFKNKTFTRLAGAYAKTPGTDFDTIGAFGGRYRCNLTDNGVEVAKYGDSAYTQTGKLLQAVNLSGTIFPIGTAVQVMVKQPKYYYKVVPLELEKNDECEIVNITFGAAEQGGNINISLDGIDFTIAVRAADDPSLVAGKVRREVFPGWTLSGTGGEVVFTANKSGGKTAAFFDPGHTGVVAGIIRTQPGYIGKGFKMRKGRYYISMSKKEGFKVHPAFIKKNTEKEFIYLSAFEGCLYDVSASSYVLDDAQIADFNYDMLSSIANAKPMSGKVQALVRAAGRQLAANRGSGWSQPYAATVSCSQLLFAIEYASLNSQSSIGFGAVKKGDDGSSNFSELTGQTSFLGNLSGMATGTNGLVSITYRGEENLWGNIWKFVDGMNIYCDIANNTHELYVSDHDFSESTQLPPYLNAGITLSTSSGYVSAFAYNQPFDWLFVPAQTLGDSALPVGDLLLQDALINGYKTAMLGGLWYSQEQGGAYAWRINNNLAYRSRILGARLVYVPSNA